MMTRHCSEEELQLFAGGNHVPAPEMMQHMESCPSCREQIATYRLIFGAIKEQHAPAFDFDLSAAVMQELQPVKTRTSGKHFYAILTVVLTAIPVIASLWIFRGNFTALSASVSFSFLVISIITCTGIIGFKVFKLYQRYDLQIKKLNFSE